MVIIVTDGPCGGLLCHFPIQFFTGFPLFRGGFLLVLVSACGQQDVVI
jgi:hypothetical protein